ncbi:hypothetical protein HPP92_004900 [Vanilla planifolia]|uniref:Uncharacterized protein n=1 Tax=Vanilla planifolia TaxID=51239 RepID=A0A835RTP7_VANPL|nr:hypothetical protein HPP92_005245 [Vanilla planifolia]KAG0493906.1 hypothetical protein HPP92_004900 [Vanilla planifolia]
MLPLLIQIVFKLNKTESTKKAKTLGSKFRITTHLHQLPPTFKINCNGRNDHSKVFNELLVKGHQFIRTTDVVNNSVSQQLLNGGGLQVSNKHVDIHQVAFDLLDLFFVQSKPLTIEIEPNESEIQVPSSQIQSGILRWMALEEFVKQPFHREDELLNDDRLAYHIYTMGISYEGKQLLKML